MDPKWYLPGSCKKYKFIKSNPFPPPFKKRKVTMSPSHTLTPIQSTLIHISTLSVHISGLVGLYTSAAVAVSVFGLLGGGGIVDFHRGRTGTPAASTWWRSARRRAGPAARLPWREATSSASSWGSLAEAIFSAWWLCARNSPRARSDLFWGWGPTPDPGRAKNEKSSIRRDGLLLGKRPSGSSNQLSMTASVCHAATFCSWDIWPQLVGGQRMEVAGRATWMGWPCSQSRRPAQSAGQLPVFNRSIVDNANDGSLPCGVRAGEGGIRGAVGISLTLAADGRVEGGGRSRGTFCSGCGVGDGGRGISRTSARWGSCSIKAITSSRSSGSSDCPGNSGWLTAESSAQSFSAGLSCWRSGKSLPTCAVGRKPYQQSQSWGREHFLWCCDRQRSLLRDSTS